MLIRKMVFLLRGMIFIFKTIALNQATRPLKKKKTTINEYICPVCGGKQTGKIGMTTFFCHACLVEFNSKSQVFMITEDGLLEAKEVMPDAK